MLVVIALGGHALRRRAEPMTAENQRATIQTAAQALAPVAAEHQIVIGYGNGPQAGLVALQGAESRTVDTYPLDVPGTQAEGIFGYMLEQELGTLLPFERPFTTMLTMVEVDPEDPAFADPATFVGPVYSAEEAAHLAAEKGWLFKADGVHKRRVVASAQAKRIFELRPIKWLLEKNTIVVATGGAGIPTRYEPGTSRKLVSVDCVVDKDFVWELLARELGADVFVMLTDADAVYADWGQPSQAAIRRASPAVLRTLPFAADSMGPKVTAACRFAEATGNRAVIGGLAELTKALNGQAGTTISVRETGITLTPSAPAASLRGVPQAAAGA
jgi:carbamate kinase